MDYLKIIAGVFLIGRIAAIILYSDVIKIQIKLLRRPIDPDVWDFRQRLHYMTLTLLLSCIPSVILDIAVIAGVERTAPYLVVYAAFNVISVLVAAVMIKEMYKLVINSNEVDNLEKAHVGRTITRKGRLLRRSKRTV